jgi:iron complex outermembrane recepter protein
MGTYFLINLIRNCQYFAIKTMVLLVHNTRQKLKGPCIVIPSIAEGSSHEPPRTRSLHSLRSVERTNCFLSCTMLLVIGLVVFGQGYTIAQENRTVDFTEFSLEELMDVEVKLASKKEQPLFETSAAVHVLTQEHIRRSGATSIPEILRLVPGLHVARVDANKWAISARGFNTLFANKLLVMIDGRSVYTPLFAGVYWDVQDVMIEDIDRIEVIRGPGASLWGANAVNGVINVITKQSSLTQGALITGGGSEEQGFVNGRFGGQISPNASYRVYAKYFNRDESQTPLAAQAADAWKMIRGGAFGLTGRPVIKTR